MHLKIIRTKPMANKRKLKIEQLLYKIFVCTLLLIAFNVKAQTTDNSDSLQVVFSHKAGFYESFFTLSLSVPDDRFDFVYTVDGSNPQTSSTARQGGKFKELSINPTFTSGRPKTPCFIVRAALKNSNGEIELPVTNTYIFLNEVIKQKHPGGNWPTFNVNGQIIDLEMDDDVTNSPQYQHQMVDALKAIPSISVVADLDALFDSEKGIYVNAWGHGPDWERFCSVELIDADPTAGFNVNAGLRIRGGWSRHNDYPKHAFRLFFREEYGNAKLKFPLFESEGASEFDKIDLRCAQNYAWSNGQSRNTMVREVFSRDSQRDMGQPYTRSRYYHLYLNGMYWGIYQTQERSEARFGESYFGGSADDYDVVKVNTDSYQYDIEATDGNLDAWEDLWRKCEKGFKNNADYFALEGKDKNGVPIKGMEKLLDIDNLIDYMISIFYTGNFDAPTSAFRGNRDPNNFYALFRRDDKSQGFIFFNHDAEHSLMHDALSPGKGLYENRVEPNGMSVDNFNKFHPQWLHQKLSENAEYRLRFADRAYMHFFNDGVFTPHKAEERFMERAKQIETAIIAESARWGDAKRGNNPFTKDGHWLPEIESVCSEFFPYRTDIVVDQLIDAGLFPSVSTVVFKVDGVKIESEKKYFQQNAQVNIASLTSTDKVYVTTNGTDPRLVGGTVNPDARLVSSNELIAVNGTTIFKVRVMRGSNWSALNTLNLVKHYEDYFNLQVTELNFWPPDSIIGADTISGKKFEFIEFKNIGGYAVDLSRLRFYSAIDFQFPPNAVLYPRQFYVIAANSKWFFERYGRSASAIFKNAFSNDGEVIAIISDNGRIVAPFAYSQQNTWYAACAGTGYTMAAAEVYPVGDPANDSFWKVSTYMHGSPFADDTRFKLTDNVYDLNLFGGLSIYPNPVSQFLNIEGFDGHSVEIDIYTVSGLKVYGGQAIGSAVVDLQQLGIDTGMLIVKLSAKGQQTFRKVIYQP